MDNLFIIEAPGKIKALESILTRLGFPSRIQATKGHLMTMPERLKPLGIDCRMREFMRVPRDPALALRVRSECETAKRVYIATDADQEGDVIAWDVAELIKDIHPAPLRVKMKGMDEDSVREAIEQATPVRKEDAIAGRTRAIVDRLIGANFSTGDVSVGRISTALLGLVHRDHPAVHRLRLVAPSKEGGRPWVAETDLKDPLDKAMALRLSRIDFPAFDMSGDDGPRVTTPKHMGDILVEAGDKLDLSPKEASDSMQRLYEAGRLSYPRAGSRGVSDSVARKIADIFRKAGYQVQADNYARKSDDAVHDAPYPIGKTDPNLDPKKLGQDESVRQVVARGLVKSGFKSTTQKATTEGLADFLLSRGFPSAVAKLVAALPWTREHGPRVPGQEAWPESGIISRRPDTVLLECAIKAGLGRPSTWPTHIQSFMNRGLVDDDLRLTERGTEWLQSSPSELLDPRVSAAIEKACENRGPRLMSDSDREPWEILSEAIVQRLPERIQRTMIASVSAEPPHPKYDPIAAMSLGESAVDRLENEHAYEYVPTVDT
jgi:DNA topoisomerase-1